MAIKFEFRPATGDEEMQAIKALQDHTLGVMGMQAKEDESFGLLVHKDGKLAGGVIGKIFWHWLNVDVVWVEKEHRGKRLGEELMKKTEEIARERKLAGIYMWVQSWQAPGFYKKLGYEQFAVFNNFPPGHQRSGFRKYLN